MTFHGKYGDFQHSILHCFVCEYIHKYENMLQLDRKLRNAFLTHSCMLRYTCENKTLLHLTVESQLASSLLQNHMIHMGSVLVKPQFHTSNWTCSVTALTKYEIWVAWLPYQWISFIFRFDVRINNDLRIYEFSPRFSLWSFSSLLCYSLRCNSVLQFWLQ